VYCKYEVIIEGKSLPRLELLEGRIHDGTKYVPPTLRRRLPEHPPATSIIMHPEWRRSGDLLFRRRSPSPLTRDYGNIYLIVRPLRQAVYHLAGVNAPVREELPQWDRSRSRVEWTEDRVEPDAALVGLLDREVGEVIAHFFPAHADPPSPADPDPMYNHKYAIRAVIYELMLAAPSLREGRQTLLEVMENDPFISTPQDEANGKAEEEARMQVNISFTWLFSNWRLILVCLYSPLQIPHRASLTEKSLTTGAPRQSRKQRTAAIKSRTGRGFNLSTPVAAYSPSSLFSLHPYSDRPEHIRVQILSASNLTSPPSILVKWHSNARAFLDYHNLRSTGLTHVNPLGTIRLAIDTRPCCCGTEAGPNSCSSYST
jgi:hypothetical protein